MNRSISVKLMVGVMLIVLIPMAAIFVLTANGISTLSRGGFATSATAELRQVSNIVTSMFGDFSYNAAMLAANPIMSRLGEMTTTHLDATAPTSSEPSREDAYGQELLPTLRLMREAHPSYKFVYVGNRNGAFVLESGDPSKTQPAGYDPRQRPWYKQAVATRRGPC